MGGGTDGKKGEGVELPEVGAAKNPQGNEIAEPTDGQISMRSVNRSSTDADQELYTLRVVVHECRDLKARDKSGSSDPFVELRWGHEKEKTSVKKDTLSPYYDEHFVFERKMTLDDMQTSKIDVSVFDKDFLRKSLIGKVMLGLPNLYMSEGHEYYQRWFPLTDTTDKNEGTQGYVKISCSLLGPADEALVHNDDDAGNQADATDIASMVLTGPTIKQVGYSLNVKIYKVEWIHKMDKFSKSDPYVEVLYGGIKAKTKTVRGKANAPILEEMRIPVMYPGVSDIIQVGLINNNILGKDDVIGTAAFNFSKIRRKPLGPVWVNFYGEATRESMGSADILDYNGELGTHFRGRVLMAMTATKKDDDPKLKTHIRIGVCKEPKPLTWVLRCDVYDGSEVPLDGNYQFEVSIGPKKVSSKIVKANNNFVRWYDQLKEIHIEMPPDVSQVPDIFVNVYNSGTLGRKRTRVGYFRFKAEDVVRFVHRPEWLLLSQPPSLDLESHQLPGYYLFKLTLGPARELGSRLPIERPDPKKYICRVFAYQARNLPAADEGGDNDAYIEVKIAGKKKKITSVINGTNHPQWYEVDQLEVKMSPRKTLQPPLQCMIYDKDFLGSDLIGRSTLYPIDYSVGFPGEPEWRDVYVNNPEDPDGELLISCQMVPMDSPIAKNLPNVKEIDITPKMKTCDIEVSTIGLRGLRVKGMDLNAPYVKFILGSGESAAQTKPSKVPDVDNPNHLELTTITTDLPANPTFAPTMTLRVMDERRGVNSAIGVGSVDLAAFMPWAAAWNNKKQAALAARMQQKARLALGMVEEDDDDPTGDAPQVQLAPDEKEFGKKGQKKTGPSLQEVPPTILMPDSVIPEERRNHLIRVQEVKEKIRIAKGGKGKKGSLDDDTKADDEEDSVDNRPQVDGELEDSVDMAPFREFYIKRGQARGLSKKELKAIEEEPFGCVAMLGCKEEDAGGFFLEQDAGTEGTQEVVGKFIGNIRIVEEEKKSKVSPPLDLEEVFKPNQYIVRVYVVDATGLTAMDIGGKADPYIRINLGGEYKVEDKEHGCKNTLEPEWYQMYEMNTSLPGEGLLSVEVWDTDLIGKDDLIGKTSIDLESRLFSKEWQELDKKPNEIRALKHPKRQGEQGKLRMWVEILSVQDASRIKPFPITLPIPMQFQLRMVVWDVQKAVFPDEQERCDLTVSAELVGSSKEKQDTDTHYDCKDGEGSFNWRIVQPLQLPYKGRGKTERVKIGLWEHHAAAENELIGEAQLNLKGFFRRAFLNPKKPQTITRQYVSVQHPDHAGVQGEVAVEFWLGSEEISTMRPVGKGRDAPNQFPHLPLPDREGSYPWWRVDRIFIKLWKKYKWYMIAAFCVVGILAIVIAAAIIMIIALGILSV